MVAYGAGDNASGAAVLLETACALKAGQPLKNDIILLFDDGEEAGYLGGFAFAKSHPWMMEVRRVIGLDTAAWGPVVLLQTTPGNAGFIRAYASSVRNPTAFGFFAAADWTISQDTSEIQPFYEQGIPGMALEDPTAFYGKHSEADALERVKEGSLQQMGEQVLALARSLGEADLLHSSTSDHCFFTLWKIGVVHYPANWNIALAILASLGLAALVVKGIRQKTFSVRSFFLAVLFLLLALVGAAVIGVMTTKIFGSLYPNLNPYTDSYLVPASLPFFLAALLIVASAYLVWRAKISNCLSAEAIALAGLFFWLLFALLTTFWLNVGSYPLHDTVNDRGGNKLFPYQVSCY